MLKNIIGVMMCVVATGNIVGGSWEYNEMHPIEYARAEEVVEPVEPVEEVILIETEIDWTPERIAKEIEVQAAKYGADAKLMSKIIACESMGSTTVQSHHVKNGKREQSYGLVQIHLPAHPNVTKEQATDPQFAIEFLAKNVNTNPNMWSCYRMVK